MHTSIEFPNLGIHLENVGKTLTIFQFDIAYYGIVIGLGIVAGAACGNVCGKTYETGT